MEEDWTDVGIAAVGKPGHPAEGAPADHVVRDARGNRIGVLQTRFDGVLVMRDAAFNKVGEYDPRTDTTRDGRGRKVGSGDHLMWLLSVATGEKAV